MTCKIINIFPEHIFNYAVVSAPRLLELIFHFILCQLLCFLFNLVLLQPTQILWNTPTQIHVTGT